MNKSYVEIKIASPKKVLEWTERSLISGELIGEVKNSKTFRDNKENKPIFEGLFCQRIFGPIKDWECSCKRYKKIKRGKLINICKTCKVEITESKIRNYRMGYIKMESSVIHPWYFKRNNNYLSIVLNKTKKRINNIICGNIFIKNKKEKITGGQAIKKLLDDINLKETRDFKIRKKIFLLKKLKKLDKEIFYPKSKKTKN